MLDKIREYLSLSKNRRFLGVIVIIAIVAAVPLTVLVALQQQDIRQRATELPVTPPFPPSETPAPGATVGFNLYPNSTNITVGRTYNILLTLQGGTNNITGVDVTVNFNKDALEVTNFQSNETFGPALINTIDNNAGVFRYAAVMTQGSKSGRIDLGTLTLKAKALGTTNVTFSNVQATALNYNGALGLDPSSTGGTYTVVTELPTNTPIPTNTIAPTNIPTNTPIPSPTVIPPTATPAPVLGDADGDNAVTILDYNIWRDEFKGIVNTKRADFDKNGRVELADFGIWRNAFEAANNSPTPTITSSATISVSPTTVDINGTINITWSGIENPNLNDFINISFDTSHSYWINNNCTWSQPTSGTPKSSGTCSISLSRDKINTSIPGPYYLQLYSGSRLTNLTRLATSNNFNLNNASPTSTPAWKRANGSLPTGKVGNYLERYYSNATCNGTPIGYYVETEKSDGSFDYSQPSFCLAKDGSTFSGRCFELTGTSSWIFPQSGNATQDNTNHSDIGCSARSSRYQTYSGYIELEWR